MGFFHWLKGLFAGDPTRDVSRLEQGVDALDATAEAVDMTGPPLREGAQRRAWRDPRLVPKRRRVGAPRKRVMSAQEAARLFSPSMRTRHRGVRDLLPDEEQLARYGLPLWRTEEELAAALELSPGQLRSFAAHRQRERRPDYVTFALPKRSGGERLIMAPKRRLKAAQRRLNRLLVDLLPVSEHAHGFRRGRSVRSGAEPHVGRAVVLHMDLADFFGTVHVGRVRGLMLALGYGYPVAASIALLTTTPPRQPVKVEGDLFHVPVGPRVCPQGAPTSPGLCNAIVLRMDRRLAGLARKLDFAYTRYADDLAFSGDDLGAIQALRAGARRIVAAEGFKLNSGKERVMRRGRRQQVTGVVVNDTAGLSRTERRRMRAAAHQLGRQLEAGGAPDPARLARLRGQLAYLQMLNPEQAGALRARLPAELR